MSVRFGRISYLNVLPIYHPLESGIIEHDFEFVSGPPSALNRLMDAGQLDVSSTSSIEYARHPEKYYLVPDIAIGSRGPVQSVLLLSRVPVKELEGRTILVSSQTHTSAALLKVLLADLWGVKTKFTTGDATAQLEVGQRPDAILAIGDEALNLRRHKDYPHQIDLGEAWRDLTNMPFIFGVWIAQRSSYKERGEIISNACQALIKAKKWGDGNLQSICTMAAESSILDDREMCSYFDGLVYDFGESERQGLLLFYKHLHKHGIIEKIPELHFLP